MGLHLSGSTGSVATVTYAGSLSAARPTANMVIWEGFPAQPTNLQDGDLWLDPASGGMLLSGSGAPTSGDGNNGDFWIKTAAPQTLYGPKASGAWPAGVSVVGATGATGSTGATGQGVPAGGTTAQVLAKNSNTDYDTHWIASSGGGAAPNISRPGAQPSGTISATLDRFGPVVGSATLTGGTVYLCPLNLTAGDSLSTFRLRLGTVSAITHMWLALADINRSVVAVTADDTTASPTNNAGGSTYREFAITGAPYVVPASGTYVLAVCMAGTTCAVFGASTFNAVPLGLTPGFGAAGTGQTTPPTVGSTLTASASNGSIIPWVWVV